MAVPLLEAGLSRLSFPSLLSAAFSKLVHLKDRKHPGIGWGGGG